MVLDYRALLNKRLLGTITEQESKMLNDWLQRSGQGREAQQLERVWKHTADYKKSYQPDAEKGLRQLKARMQAEQAPASAKTVGMKSRRTKWGMAASIAALLIFGTLLWQQFGHSTEYVVINSGDQQELVELEDGTTVLLNQHSALRYPKAFAKNVRTLELEGEAFFNVAENASRPFIVELAETQVTVLGTAFNVRAFLDEDFTEVTVESGKVRFAINKSGQAKVLTAKQKAIYTHDRAFSVGRDDALHALDWLKGDLVFENERLSTVLESLERYYRVELELDNPHLADCRIYLSKRNFPDLESVLNTLRESMKVAIQQQEEKRYSITAGSCPK